MLKLVVLIIFLALLAAIGISVGGVLKVAFGAIIAIIVGIIAFGFLFLSLAEDEKEVRIIGFFISVILFVVLYLIITYWIIGGWTELVSTIKEMIG